MGEAVAVMVFWTTREEALRVFGFLRRHWKRVAAHLGAREAGIAQEHLRLMGEDIRAWSAPSDFARVTRGRCRDLKFLATAFDRAVPSARRTSEALWDVVDAAASAYWNAESSRTEDYRRTSAGWELVREGEEDSEQ